jgi:hypothetical protein
VSDLVENLCVQNRRRTLKDIFTIRGIFVNVSKDFIPGEFCTRPTIRTLLQVIFFAHLKAKFVRSVIQNMEELISAIKQIFDEIPRKREREKKGTKRERERKIFISVYFSRKKVDVGD